MNRKLLVVVMVIGVAVGGWWWLSSQPQPGDGDGNDTEDFSCEGEPIYYHDFTTNPNFPQPEIWSSQEHFDVKPRAGEYRLSHRPDDSWTYDAPGGFAWGATLDELYYEGVSGASQKTEAWFLCLRAEAEV